jgi:hypothetical protein
LQRDTPTAGNLEKRSAARKVDNLFQSEHIAIESDRRIPFVHKVNRRLHPPYWHWGLPRELKQVSQPLLLVGGSALDEYAAGSSDSDAFGLAVVVGVADRLVSGDASVQPSFDLLALSEIEM